MDHHLSAETTAQGAEQNRPRARAEKPTAPSDVRDRHKRFNLCHLRLDPGTVRGRAEVKRWVSEAQPDVIASEDLSKM